MTTPTSEENFEAHIEQHLLDDGYVRARNYVPDLALDTGNLFEFLRSTQADRLDQLEGLLGSGIEDMLVNRLVHQLGQRGSLDVLRRGWEDHGVHFGLAFYAPASGVNPDIGQRYRSNRLSVMRQVPLGEGQSVDLALFVNGIPVVTTELKRQTAGQGISDAINQYRRRDPDLPLFRFAERAVVHFAVDTDVVAMTTTLRGPDTKFLPFNRGRNDGAGNPDVADKPKTSYLWEEVWAWESLLDLVRRFVTIHGAPTNNFRDGTLLFPRYHQLDVVRRLEDHARSHGSGESYLIQHSAGSGKSNSIAWTAHRLHSLHNKNDEQVFHTVVVVTDRRVLDRQIRDTIRGFEHTHGVIEAADRNSQQLADALERNVPIVITTLQKFPYVIERIGALPDRRYAVIVDEAHSSQSGDAAREMRAALTVGGTRDHDEEDIDVDDGIRRLMEAAGPHENLSFFAFTATPKQKTLEMFGEQLPDGSFGPFHLYTMRQAIEEGFIMDVLQNYTTYKRYFELTKLVEEDPELNVREGGRAIARFLELHPTNISQKAEVMVEHFQEKVRRKINNRAKAMVVTSSRAAAIRYYRALRDYIEEQEYSGIGVLVAFSGSIADDTGLSVTEAELNGFRESELTDQFEKPENRILVVAEKYQTGFDQPLLHTMYVDKKLQGVNAVQTLSRLNRIHPAKSETFVLDFVNTTEENQTAFQPFYEATKLAEGTDPNLLFDLRRELMDYGVIWPDDLDRYAEAFFSDTPVGQLESVLDEAATRYFGLVDEDTQEDFKQLLDRYIRLYSFLTHVVTFSDPGLEKFYLVARGLKPKIADREGRDLLDLGEEVDLVAFRLEMTSEGDVELETDGKVPLAPASGLGRGAYDEVLVRLSELIDSINDRFGTNWDPTDWMVDEQRVQRIITDDAVIEAFRSNNTRDFRRILAERYEDEVHNTRERNERVWLDTVSIDGLLDAIIAYRTPQIERYLADQHTTEELLASDESQRLEFKETFRWGTRQEQVLPGVEDAVIKTVAGFLNSGGGTLIVGVADRSGPVGIEADLATFSTPDRDSLENWFAQKLESALGFNNSRLTTLGFAEVDGRTIARVDVMGSSEPVYASVSGDSEAFFVRHGNATRKLGMADAVGYIKDQW